MRTAYPYAHLIGLDEIRPRLLSLPRSPRAAPSQCPPTMSLRGIKQRSNLREQESATVLIRMTTKLFLL